MYACCIKQRLTSADIASLVDLTHHLALKVKGGCSMPGVGCSFLSCVGMLLASKGTALLLSSTYSLGPQPFYSAGAAAGEFSLQQQAYVVLLSTLLTLAPLENLEPAEAEADARALGAAACTAMLMGMD